MIFEPNEQELEPARNSLFLLQITGLDYLRLRSHLQRAVRVEEARAVALVELATKEPEHAKNMELAADSCRREAEHLTRIMDGLRSAWKPGREPR